MKKFTGLTVALVALGFQIVSFAQASEVSWQCDADNLEGLGVSEARGVFNGEVNWDCWHGGGICARHATGTVIGGLEGTSTVFQGKHFTLVLHTDVAPLADGSVSGHIFAVAEGPQDMGGGLTLSEKVTCKKAD